MLNKKSRVLFATFSMWTDGQRMPTNGNLEPLRDFLVPRIGKLILIDQPHPGSDRVMPIIEGANRQLSSLWMYLLWPFLSVYNNQGTQIVFKIRDFLSVFDAASRNNLKYNYFIGVECVNTLAGLLLKKIGRVDQVIYYVLDYSPNRYNPIINKLYLALDRYCAEHSDYIWDVSAAIHPARISSGLKKSAPVIVVPIGIYPEQLMFTRPKERKPFSICYLGTLGEEQGPDLAIQMMPLIIKKYPQATLHIVGGGQKNLERLKSLALSLDLTDRIIFYGYVVKNVEMAKILSSCYVGIAPYRNFSNSTRLYADASKLRSYAAARLPIVSTSVPPLGSELKEIGGAILSKDNSRDLSKAVVSLFKNPKLYANIRKVLIKFAKKNTWDHEFAKAFSKSQ